MTEETPKKRTKGLVIVCTGDGKGKTTAALGMAFRSAGHHYRVAVVQFIKGTMKTGEEQAAKMVAPYIDWTVSGRGFTAGPLNVATHEEHFQAAQEAIRIAEEKLTSGEFRMVILDEVLGAINAKIVTVEQILSLIQKKPPTVHLVLTGRGASQEIVDAADLVTEMKLIKHPYNDQGVIAQKGVEF
ncbi:MAG: cob(I)yrinic acid a,c-diamide adenosyltransferase [Chloroflexi bacterium]|nr:cob(I)yrinic acid a,c-diamide adenosyltransferase [Chloroflexota bacterium]